MTGTNIVNINKSSNYDIYIGRPRILESWKFGNPFVIGRDGTRAEVIQKYKEWLLYDLSSFNPDATPARRKWILSSLSSIKGKTLGCFCDFPDQDCHGRVLIELSEMPESPKTLAIIGTAGRRDDASKLSRDHFNRMVECAKFVMRQHNVTRLVSGGAAWADFVATLIECPQKDIFIPAKSSDLKILQYYHNEFSKVIGFDTYQNMVGNTTLTTYSIGGFKERNTEVAKRADVYLAMTFGNGRNIKSGGTLDTVSKIKQFNPDCIGYHLDLNTLKLYKI